MHIRIVGELKNISLLDTDAPTCPDRGCILSRLEQGLITVSKILFRDMLH